MRTGLGVRALKALPDCTNAPSAMPLEHVRRNAASIALPIELPMLWLCLKPAPSMQAWLPNSPPRCVSVVDLMLVLR